MRETAMLTSDQRTSVDKELAEALGDELGLLGDRALVRRVQAISYRIDAESVLARSRAAENRRHVSIRPAPDTMAYVTALLPVAQGVAVHAALTVAAAAARAAGDERSKGQVMADTLADRLTGRSLAEGPSVEVQVVMTDRALLDGDDTPAYVLGFGAMPADGTLVVMDSRRRVFDGPVRRFLLARDLTCRTPGSDGRRQRPGPLRALQPARGAARLVRPLVRHPAGPVVRSVAPHVVETTTPTEHA